MLINNIELLTLRNKINELNTDLLKIRPYNLEYNCTSTYNEFSYNLLDEVVTKANTIAVIPIILGYTYAGARPTIAIPTENSPTGTVWIEVATATVVKVRYLVFYK